MPWFLGLLGSVGSGVGAAGSALGSAASALGSGAAALGQGAVSGLTSAAGGAGAGAGGAGAAGMSAAIPSAAGAGAAGMSAAVPVGGAGLGAGGLGSTVAGLTPGMTPATGLAGGLQSLGGQLSSFGQSASNAAPNVSNYLQQQGIGGRMANRVLGGQGNILSPQTPGGGQPPSIGESLLGNAMGKVLGGGPGSQLPPMPEVAGPVPRRQQGGPMSFNQTRLPQRVAPNYNDFLTGSLYGNQMLQNGLL